MNTILSAHPNIAIPLSETHFLCDCSQTNSHPDRNCPRDFESFWEDYIRSDRFSRLGVDTNAVLSRILSTGKYDYKTIFTSVMQEYASKMKKPRWGEKTPAHYRYVNILLEWYPRARIIWMLRDPRAVIASLLRMSWANKSVKIQAKQWRDSILSFEQQWAGNERVRLVQYEALVNNPESEIKQVCKFIDEEYTPAMIENRSEANNPIINRNKVDENFFKHALRSINQNSLETWQSNLSPSQIAMVENITRSEMLEHTYQPITNRLNFQSVPLFLDKGWSKVKRVGVKLVQSGGSDH